MHQSQTATSVATGPPRRPAAPVTGFRPDVEGLRAVAVGLVLAYHAGLDQVPGGFVGVDVFFVISGFLITGLLLKELRQTSTISIAGFYARRAKRLLPAAAVVLASTAALTAAFLPRISWSEIGGDIVAAAAYVVNWRLADRSVDYLAEDSEASPVQHFWSLAVEEQFYLVWPLLLLLAAWWARRKGTTLRHELWLGLAVIAVPSLVWSVYRTADDPAVSFFVTTTRMWELAIGAALALAATQLRRIPQAAAVVVGWSGLAAIGLAAVVYSTETAWPGYAALLPTLGTAAVIAAGFAAGPNGPVRLLGTRGFTWVGGLSYSLYLWHWPLVVVAAAYWDGLRPLLGLLVVTASVVPAWLTLRLVENPIRFSTTTFQRPANALRLGAALTVTGALAGVSLLVATASAAGPAAANAAGARALGDNPTDHQISRSAETVTPDPLHAVDDVPDAYDRGCQTDQNTAEPTACEYGDANGDVTVALVGDSKAMQWISALDTIGQQQGWRIVTYAKSRCAFADATLPINGTAYTSCDEWNDEVLAALRDEPPDVVLTSQGSGTGAAAPQHPTETSQQAMVDGLIQRWQEVAGYGSAVAVLRDNPYPADDVDPVYECVDENRDALQSCTSDRAAAEDGGAGSTQLTAARQAGEVDVIDVNDYICPGSTCPAVIGDALVYRQGSHITRTYVNTLAPQLQQQLAPVVDNA